MNRKKIIELENVSVLCDNEWILSNINITVKQGECFAVIGPNGAGKSTLISVIAGHLWATKGNVTVLGEKFGETELIKLREHIGIIESIRTPQCKDWTTARDVVATGLHGTTILTDWLSISNQDWHKVDKELESLGLEHLASTPYGKLSSGERKKVLIARAMVSKPELLILDEVTSALDLGARVAVVKTLEKLLRRKNPPTLVIVSHHLEELPSSVNKVLLLKNGRVIKQGNPSEILTSENLSKTFDCQVDVIHKNGKYITLVNQDEWKL